MIETAMPFRAGRRWRSWGRPLLLLGTAFLGVALFFRLLTLGLHKFPEPIGSRAPLFAEGAWRTLMLTVVSATIGLGVGFALSLLSLSRNLLIRALAGSIIWVIRGTPLLVQILFCYFALPSLVPALRLEDFGAAVVALSLNVGAYNAEVIRAGIMAIPKGQREAAASLGLNGAQSMIFIILPQALRIVIPPLVNNVVALLKDSSLASSIGLLELALAGSRVSSETFLPVPVLTTVALIYLLLTTALTSVTHALERLLGSPSTPATARPHP